MTTNSNIQITINNIIGGQGDYGTFAGLFLQVCQSKIKCFSQNYKIWYEFKNHRWIETNMYVLFSEKLVPLFVDKKNELCKTLVTLDTNSNEWQNIFDKINNVSSTIKSLNCNVFKSFVINECSKLEYDPNFKNKLDENINLLCFTDGIYDLKTFTFRDGTPEDYVSLCVGYPYKKYDANDVIVREIHAFLNESQPDLDMKSYLMRILSTCVSGSVNDETAYIFQSLGSSGTTTVTELMRHTLGDYFKLTDSDILTGRSPFNMKGIRMVGTYEPVNYGFMKLFTGGDTICDINIHNDRIYYKQQFKLFTCCNKLNKIDGDDSDNTFRRIKVIPFTQKLTSNPKLSEKIPNWKQTFMSMLLDCYEKQYLVHGIQHPKVVLESSEKYRQLCDPYFHFISDNLEGTRNDNDVINIEDLFELMKRWYKLNYKTKCPNRKELINYLYERKYIRSSRDLTLFGYKLKNLPNNAHISPLSDIASSGSKVSTNQVTPKLPDRSTLDEIVKMMQSNNITKILITEGKITTEYKI